MRTILTLALAVACMSACKPANPAARQHTPKAAPAAPGADPAKVVEIPKQTEKKAESGEKKAAEAPAAAVADSGAPGDAAKGEAIYKRVCVACHQADGTGMNGMLAANFKKEPERLKKSDAELLKSIAEGKSPAGGKGPIMPPQKGVLKPQEMKDALAYIRKAFGG